MKPKPILECGHVANGRLIGTDKPCCVICIDTGCAGAEDIMVPQPKLVNRQAACTYCKRVEPSSKAFTTLAFFQYLPAREYDDFYCGCRGWD